jgi:hypothetical protein
MNHLNKTLIFPAVCTALIVTISGCNTFNQVKLEDFSVNLNSPQIEIGEIELQMETMMGFGKLKKQNVTVLYFPREDAVCLRYKYEFYNYHQFWNKRGRLGFITALQNYNSDYGARDLQRNSRKSLEKYGIVRGYLIWQQLSITIRAYANMNIELGYAFNDKSPYFTVFQRNAEYIDDISRETRTSPNITMYFTRAQAAELAELFEQYMTIDMYIPDTDGVEYDDYNEINVPASNSDVSKDVY